MKKDNKAELISKLAGKAIKAVMDLGARKFSVFVSKDFVMTATRVWYKRGRNDARDPTIVISFGRPNYSGRQFLKRNKKNLSFPCNQIKFPKK